MQQLPPVLYRGSVKNVRGEVSQDFVLFEFSDRYSVFDWGEMPDLIKDKGATLAMMGKGFFHYLGKKENWQSLFSSKTLYENFDSEYLDNLRASKTYEALAQNGLGHHAHLENSESLSSFLKVKNVRVLRPPFTGKNYDYSAYKDRLTNTLVPLEIIFRLGLVPGNSLSKRCGSDILKWKKFGFDHVPSNGPLKKPVIDFSTKLERGDRYLDYPEAQVISGMSDEEWQTLNEITNLIALNLFSFHAEIDLDLWDGKIEMAFVEVNGKREFILVDSIGIDELRLLYKGKSFSKEFLREVYKDGTWHRNLELAKKLSPSTGEDFKSICLRRFHSSPESLPIEIKERAEAVYKSYANAVTMKVFKRNYFGEEYTLKNYSERYL